MITFRKKALVAAVGLGAALAFAPAQSYVMSSAVIEMTNFRILGSDGQILDAAGANNPAPAGDFSSLVFTSTADQFAALTGFVTIVNNTGVAPIDYLPICLGGNCTQFTNALNNDYPHLVAAPVSGNYSAADQSESGAPVDNLAGFPDPAAVANGSFAGLDTGTVAASSASNNNLNAAFVFKLTNDQATGITFAFDVDAFLQVATSADELAPGFATASYQLDFSLTNLLTQQTIFNFAPDLFGIGTKTISINAGLPFNLENIKNEVQTAWSSTTGALIAGVPYQLSARIQTNADAERLAVPEPTMLGLIGIGLLAFGATRARRKTSLG